MSVPGGRASGLVPGVPSPSLLAVAGAPSPGFAARASRGTGQWNSHGQVPRDWALETSRPACPRDPRASAPRAGACGGRCSGRCDSLRSSVGRHDSLRSPVGLSRVWASSLPSDLASPRHLGSVDCSAWLGWGGDSQAPHTLGCKLEVGSQNFCFDGTRSLCICFSLGRTGISAARPAPLVRARRAVPAALDVGVCACVRAHLRVHVCT